MFQISCFEFRASIAKQWVGGMFLLHFPWAFVIKILERLLIPLYPVAVSDYLYLPRLSAISHRLTIAES